MANRAPGELDSKLQKNNEIRIFWSSRSWTWIGRIGPTRHTLARRAWLDTGSTLHCRGAIFVRGDARCAIEGHSCVTVCSSLMTAGQPKLPPLRRDGRQTVDPAMTVEQRALISGGGQGIQNSACRVYNGAHTTLSLHRASFPEGYRAQGSGISSESAVEMIDNPEATISEGTSLRSIRAPRRRKEPLWLSATPPDRPPIQDDCHRYSQTLALARYSCEFSPGWAERSRMEIRAVALTVRRERFGVSCPSTLWGRTHDGLYAIGGPGRTRTCDLRIMSPLL